VWTYTTKVDKCAKIVDNERSGANVHEKQSHEVHRRIQKDHRLAIPIMKDLCPDSKRIWCVVLGPVQLGKKIFPGSGG
jgi:hypothetical protein